MTGTGLDPLSTAAANKLILSTPETQAGPLVGRALALRSALSSEPTSFPPRAAKWRFGRRSFSNTPKSLRNKACSVVMEIGQSPFFACFPRATFERRSHRQKRKACRVDTSSLAAADQHILARWVCLSGDVFARDGRRLVSIGAGAVLECHICRSRAEARTWSPSPRSSKTKVAVQPHWNIRIR